MTYDARHSMTFNGRSALSYDLRGDLSSSLAQGVSPTYAYNAFHQRVKKTVGSTATLFAYDDEGNLAGEYSATGAAIQEHVYLNGMPVAVVANGQTYAVHTDYLGTPRSVTLGSTLVWKWENLDPFGKNPPSIQTLVYNLRFPGQYYDAESGLHYNNHRTYDPELGRYVQSDPLGVNAGPDTVVYAGHSPLSNFDKLGLDTEVIRVVDNTFDGLFIDHIALNINGDVYEFTSGSAIELNFSFTDGFTIGRSSDSPNGKPIKAFQNYYAAKNLSFESYTLKTSAAQEQTLISFFKQMNAKGANGKSQHAYGISNNEFNICSTVAREALSIIGIASDGSTYPRGMYKSTKASAISQRMTKKIRKETKFYNTSKENWENQK